MKQVVVILLLLACSMGELRAQLADKEANKGLNNAIGLYLGYVQGYFKDLNFSPLNYQINGSILSLYYLRSKPAGKSIFSTYLQFSPSTISSRYSEDFTSDYLIGKIEINYLRKLKWEKENWNLFLGGQYKTNLNYIDYLNLNAFSFLFAYSLGVKGLLDYQIHERHVLQSSLAIPFVSLLVRPPYSGHNKELSANQNRPLRLLTNGELASFNKYRAFDWSTRYSYKLSSRFNLHLGYTMSFYQTLEENQFTNLQNHIFLGTSVNF